MSVVPSIQISLRTTPLFGATTSLSTSPDSRAGSSTSEAPQRRHISSDVELTSPHREHLFRFICGSLLVFPPSTLPRTFRVSKTDRRRACLCIHHFQSQPCRATE